MIRAIFRSETQDVFDGTTFVRRSAVLANVLDAPVAKLTMRDNVNACEDLIDAWTLCETM